MVSVGVLIAILAVAGRVFQTAQQVSNIGNAAADVLQETAAIEKQIRQDVSRISPQGAIAIHSVRVRNDQNIIDWELAGGQGARPGLINPNLDADDHIRCDQLVFFTEGMTRVKQHGSDGMGPGDWFPKLLGEGSMIYYGHALQFPEELRPCTINPGGEVDGHNNPPVLYGHDIDFAQLRESDRELTPWFHGGITPTVPTLHRLYPRASTNDDYDYFTMHFPEQAADPILGTQPEARSWVLARQEVVLGDDDQQLPGTPNKRIYLMRAFGAMSVFPVDPRWNASFGSIHFRTKPLLESGRVDLAGMRLSGVREALGVSRDGDNPNGILPANRSFDSADTYEWDDGSINRGILDAGHATPLPGLGDEEGTQRELIKSLVRWPRAERAAPGEGRFDQHLTLATLGSACSSFIVEWTWDDGVGEADTQYTDGPTGRQRDITWHGLVTDPSDTFDGQTGDPYLSQRWFGMYDQAREVMPFSDLDAATQEISEPWQSFSSIFPGDVDPDYQTAGTKAPSTVRTNAIESFGHPQTFTPDEVHHEYWAVFGLNRDRPLLDVDWHTRFGGVTSDGNGDSEPDGDGYADFDTSFTPWPTALRFTLVLHDTRIRLENGQALQFVVRLPERCQ
jgi:hypothetical protein